MRTWGSYLEAVAGFQLHRLTEAKDSFLRAFDGRHFLDKRAGVDVMAGLAITHQLLGEADLADNVAAELAVLAKNNGDPTSVNVASSCRARLALLRGDARNGWPLGTQPRPRA